MTDFSPLSRDKADLLRAVRHVALDMDGTIYKGGTVFPFTTPFLEQLAEAGVTHSFLTNNSSKSVAEYGGHLRRMGLRAEPEEIHISTHAVIGYLRSRHPGVRRVFTLASPGMDAELRAAGLELTADNPDDEPDAVIVGFDLDLSYARLCRAAWWLTQGKLFLASHPDLVCPTDQPTVLIDCGAVCAALTAATGREPDAVPGKPNPLMLDGLLRGRGLRPEELLMVGDRIYTDMEMARRAGCLGALVLSGEATRADADAMASPPDLVVRDLAELGELFTQARSGAASTAAVAS